MEEQEIAQAEEGRAGSEPAAELRIGAVEGGQGLVEDVPAEVWILGMEVAQVPLQNHGLVVAQQ